MVLLDYLLQGGLDGRSLLEGLATDARLAALHACIAIPATPQLDAQVEHLRAALGVPLLTKPFELDDLLSAIAQAEVRLWADAPIPTRENPHRRRPSRWAGQDTALCLLRTRRDN